MTPSGKERISEICSTAVEWFVWLGCPAGWLACWLVDWLAGCPAGWLSQVFSPEESSMNSSWPPLPGVRQALLLADSGYNL